MVTRRTAFALTAGLVALGLAACGGTGPSMPDDDPMMMQSGSPSASAQAAAAQLAQDDDRRAGGVKHR